MGDRVDGSDLAFQALLAIVDNAVVRLNGWDVRVQGFDNDNDHFHREADDLMLKICQHQSEVEPSALNGLRKEVEALRDIMSQEGLMEQHGTEILGYRYEKTLEFLKAYEKVKVPKGRTESDSSKHETNMSLKNQYLAQAFIVDSPHAKPPEKQHLVLGSLWIWRENPLPRTASHPRKGRLNVKTQFSIELPGFD